MRQQLWLLGLLGIGISVSLSGVVAHAQEDAAPGIWRVEVAGLEEPAEVEPQGWWAKIRHFLSASRPGIIRPEPGTTFVVTSSGYASSPYQTDSTPCVTAAGTRVREGTVASNFLPLGTLLRINDEMHIVEDRMNPRYAGKFIDIWFPRTSDALVHGRRRLEIEIIGYGAPGQPLLEQEILEQGVVERTSLRFIAHMRKVGTFLRAAVDPGVNRFDVNCFEQGSDNL